jgi:putative transposase
VLVAIGVTDTGHNLVLGFQAGNKESAYSWREFFKDLKARGLDGQVATLGIMDGLRGLETVFRVEFPMTFPQKTRPFPS